MSWEDTLTYWVFKVLHQTERSHVMTFGFMNISFLWVAIDRKHKVWYWWNYIWKDFSNTFCYLWLFHVNVQGYYSWQFMWACCKPCIVLYCTSHFCWYFHYYWSYCVEIWHEDRGWIDRHPVKISVISIHTRKSYVD